MMSITLSLLHQTNSITYARSKTGMRMARSKWCDLHSDNCGPLMDLMFMMPMPSKCPLSSHWWHGPGNRTMYISNAIVGSCPPPPIVESCMLDYERIAWGALKAVFPKSARMPLSLDPVCVAEFWELGLTEAYFDLDCPELIKVYVWPWGMAQLVQWTISQVQHPSPTALGGV